MTVVTPQTGTDPAARMRLQIVVRGAVQGVGFRPFVYRHAKELGLSGWVGNSTEGVTLEAEGQAQGIAALLGRIRNAPPPNAAVSSIQSRAIKPCGEEEFVIRPSDALGRRSAQVLPDLATCDECLRELFDPKNRRYLYPFINCTHCGPRYSIVEDIPYDRARTSMRRFLLCSLCRAEYENPADRRFHAEPNACPDCGPRLTLMDRAGACLACDHEALLAAASAVREGLIVAAKGVGGFHLIADARDEAVLHRLRARKQRAEKPFAVLFSSLADLAESCIVSPDEEALLISPARPIVLLQRKACAIAEAVAPRNPWLGALLPYAPLHHLLMRELGIPVVATSGNVSDEPIVIDEAEALDCLGGIADIFLVHDRPIVRPVDDSVARIVCGRVLLLRRARGYAPLTVPVKEVASGILALGGHLKTTVALTREHGVFLSQHLGDLATVSARAAHAAAVADTSRLHGERPRLVVRDLHPDYASSRAAEALGLPVVAVQHHLAHVVSGMAEHEIKPPVLGIAWDGTGYGSDRTIWGGEFLHVTNGGWRRVAHLRLFPLPGGEIAVREPRRAALGLLYEAYGEDAIAMTDLAPLATFSPTERTIMRRMLAGKLNAPRASSVGRLFDAFAALIGLCQKSSYEGQAAIMLEGAALSCTTDQSYEFAIQETRERDEPFVVDWQPALDAALADLRQRIDLGMIAAMLHNGLAEAIVTVAREIGEPRVMLTGGCFQNARLTETTVARLRAAGLKPFWHRHVPPNDGGIALGQAVWAAWLEQGRVRPCA